MFSVVALIASLWGMAAIAQAAPNIGFTLDAPTSVLYGTQAPVTLRATNPAGEPYGYNLSYRVELPPGVSYVAGSAGTVGEPVIVEPAGGGEDDPDLGERGRPLAQLVQRDRL